MDIYLNRSVRTTTPNAANQKFYRENRIQSIDIGGNPVNLSVSPRLTDTIGTSRTRPELPN